MKSLYRKPSYVYVASSWRNYMQAGICAALRSAGIDHYDFKDSEGFHWSEVDLTLDNDGLVTEQAYLRAIQEPRAEAGFARDMKALNNSDCTVLVLPAGNSAHLELGYARGRGQRTCILLPVGADVRPDLMYKMADLITGDMMELLTWLGVDD